MSHTHSLSEWAAFISLGVGFWSSCAAAVWLFADADLADFDPRPAVRRAGLVCRVAVSHVPPLVWDVTHSEALYPLLREWDNAPHAIRQFLRDAACGLAALYVLTIPTGSTR